MPLRPTLVAVLVLALATPIRAEPVQDTAALDRLVERFTGRPSGAPGGAQRPVNPRLRLAACRTDPVTSWFGGGQTSVRVSCPVPGGWTVFVPVNVKSDPADMLLVRRGDTVAVQLRGPGFVLTARGEALAAGRMGAVVPVRLAGQPRSASTTSATVLASGKVGIDLPQTGGKDLPTAP